MSRLPKQNVTYARNPMYVFYAVGGLLIFLLSLLLVQGPGVGTLETTIFDLFYRLPDQLSPLFVSILILGSAGLAFVSCVVSLTRRRHDIALRILAASTLAYFVSQLLSTWIGRSQSDYSLIGVISRVHIVSSGFPAALVAVATATGLTISLYTARSNRRWLTYNSILVAISGLYLALYLPLDAVGGYSVGLFCFSIVSLGFGSVYHPISIKKLTRALQKGGMKNLVLKPASVDARGSVPFFGSYENGPVFVKVFNQDNNAADWLFKLLRRLQYRRLEDEVPSLTPKRTIEHEAYITMLAKSSAGVRAPQVIGVFKVSHNSYAMATELIRSDGLDKLKRKDITDKMLLETWKQIMQLHKGRIIHKDLRAANVMIEKATRLPWIIDFGFSESAIQEKSFYKDNVEFIASSATKVGAQRAVVAAHRSLGSKSIKEALPYMQYAALSGATTTDMKKKPRLLIEVRNMMANVSGANQQESKKAKLSRIGRPNTKKLSK